MHGTLPIRQTYKTPEALGFTQEEFDALAWFVDQYDAGRIVDVDRNVSKAYDVFNGRPDPKKFIPDKFYMPRIGAYTDCGTVGCILGHVLHRIDDVFNHHWPSKMMDLFYEYPKGTKAADARDATVRVLRGEPAWP